MGFPDGSNSRGYILIAPLDARAHLDLDAWKKRVTNAA
jgi:hypothetical protein